jgi:hypothetical protein
MKLDENLARLRDQQSNELSGFQCGDEILAEPFLTYKPGGGMAPLVTRLGPPSQPIWPTQSEVAYIVQHIVS